jgi:hypothetical protein
VEKRSAQDDSAKALAVDSDIGFGIGIILEGKHLSVEVSRIWNLGGGCINHNLAM